ncbi:MAG: nitroreductase family protein [Duodenibacillus sp.]|nr:nitroreductase family protein [Duodenibacillus sp.]
MNEAMTNLLTRRSLRAFKPDMVPGPLLDQIVEAGLYAPSGMGRQSAIIVVITDKAVRDAYAKVNGEAAGREGDPFYGAPVIMAVLARQSVPTHVNDGSLVIGNILNAAHALGLAGCWIHRAKQCFESGLGRELRARLGIDDDYVGIGNAAIGFAAAEWPEAAPRAEGRVLRV